MLQKKDLTQKGGYYNRGVGEGRGLSLSYSTSMFILRKQKMEIKMSAVQDQQRSGLFLLRGQVNFFKVV